MARIALIGGHGKVAMLAAPMLVADEHEVMSVFRDPDDTVDVAGTGAVAKAADVESMDTGELTSLLEGHDAVIWSAGAGGGSPERTYAVDRDAAIRSIDAAVAAGVPRFVMVSYFGSDVNHDVPVDNPFFHYAEAKAAADEYLRGTSLQWTILKPSALTTDASHGTLDDAPTQSGPTARALVAEVIRAVVSADPAAVASCELEFTDGDRPIADALAALRPRET